MSIEFDELWGCLTWNNDLKNRDYDFISHEMTWDDGLGHENPSKVFEYGIGDMRMNLIWWCVEISQELDVGEPTSE